jgi:anti-sigma factor RsiW
MVCEACSEKLDAYLDGELSAAEAQAIGLHLQSCAACAAESLRRVQQKRAVHSAGLRYTPDPAFRARIQKSAARRGTSRWASFRFPLLAGALALLLVGAFVFNLDRNRSREQRLLSELADLHVATLASSNPVDVLSTDRHTVKPWFAGKIPFTFNLPELQDSPFSLVGGRVSYLNQSAGAELLFHIRQHQISVFIFQGQAVGRMGAPDPVQSTTSFTVRSWSHNGLRYFVIGDASPQDIDKLSELLKSAG